MKKTTKIWLITALLLLVAGFIAFAGIMSVYNYDFNRLSTVKYETNTYEVDEFFNKIYIDADTSEIKFVPSDDGKCKIICLEQENAKHSAEVRDETLVINTQDNRKWFNFIGIFMGDTSITVYLPQSSYDSLTIDTDTGDISIPKDFTFKNIKIDGDTSSVECFSQVLGTAQISLGTGSIKADGVSAEKIDFATDTGDINISSASVSGNIKIETDTGGVCIKNTVCTGFDAQSDTGDILISKVVAAGDLSVENDTGSVIFENSDAARIYVVTSTGDVKGTLLSEKIFITETSVGDVNVPKTVSGGVCEIKTSTGDIKLQIAGQQ